MRSIRPERCVRAQRRLPSVEALEPRLLHSGDGAAGAVSEAGAALAAWDASAVQAWVAPVQTQAVTPASAGELVVVDARVPDAQRLLAAFEAQREAGRVLEVVVVGADDDALAVIDAALGASQAPWTAVHLVGHGDPGEVVLGATRFDAALLRTRAGEIAQWSERLAPDADLLVWGCDSGAGDAGAALLDGLAALTGADVAASTDATGGLAFGGNWSLEAQRGAIETAAPLDAALQASYDGLLAITNLDGSDATVATNVIEQEASGTSGAGRQVAASAAGTVYVWIENDGQATRVMGRFDGPGRVGADFEITGGDRTTRSSPSVAVDGAGNAFFAWTQVDDAGCQRVSVAYFTAPQSVGGSMTQVGVETYADFDVSGSVERARASVAMSADGRRAAVVWEIAGTDGSVTYRDIQMRRFELVPPGGGPASMQALDPAPVYITSQQGLFDWHPDVAIRDDGSGWVVFSGSDPTTPVDPSTEGIYLVAFAADGTVPLPSSRPTAQTGIQIAANASTVTQRHPTVAMDPAGNGLVAWVSAQGSGTTILARALDGSGQPVGATLALPDSAGGAQPSVAAISDGRFALAWAGPSAGGSGSDVLAIEVRVSGAGATAVSAPLRANATTDLDQIGPSIAASGGRVTVAWTEVGANNGKAAFETRRFDTVVEPVFTRVGPTTALREGDASVVEFDVSLAARPVGDQVIELSATMLGQLQLSTTRLTFTESNWNVAQRVSVSVIDDPVVDGTATVGLQATVAGVASRFADVAVADDDVANVFTVTSNADTSAFGAGTVTPLMLYERMVAGQPVTLRDALRAANDAGTSTPGAPAARDRIVFALPAGQERITLLSSLPTIVSPVDIDGGAFVDGRPAVELLLSRTVSTSVEIDLLTLGPGSDGSRIAGLAIGGGWDGLSVRSSGNLVENTWIGIGRDGEVDPSSTFRNRWRGISVTDAGKSSDAGQANNVFRNNRIANNGEGGIRLLGRGADFIVVTGNLIEGNGRASGAAEGGYGIRLLNGAEGARIGGDPATSPGDGNVIRNNGRYGILADDSARMNALLGNRITGQSTAIRVEWEDAPAPPTVSIASAVTSGPGTAQVGVDVSVRSVGGRPVRIDLYAGTSASDLAWVGSITLAPDASGRVSGRMTLQVPTGTPFLTATASVEVSANGKTSATTSGTSSTVRMQPSTPTAAPAPAPAPSSYVAPASGQGPTGIGLAPALGDVVAGSSTAGPGSGSQAAGAAAQASTSGGTSAASGGDGAARTVATGTATGTATGASAATSAATTAATTAVAGVRATASPGPTATPTAIAAPAAFAPAPQAAAGPASAVAASGDAAATGVPGPEAVSPSTGGPGAIVDGSGASRSTYAVGGDASRRGAAGGLPERVRLETTVAGPATEALRETDYADAVQQTRQEAVAQFEARTVLVTSSVMLGTSLSIGYAVWMARGGVLLTSLLASMPAWRSIDPLPVLARTDALGRDDETEDDSLRGLLARAAERADASRASDAAGASAVPQAVPAAGSA